ncbi:MAG TPA: family 16 glycoside hydrolase [Gemmataceae bacterium]|nr:family 16 glycoside hydrolase [Gemmataceae bacterium]
MKPLRWTAALLLALAVAVPALTDDKTKDAGFVPMFNGKDLAGWVNVNCAPDTFFVKDNEIITTGKPTGYLRTEKQYENFIAEFDWMHVPPEPGAVGNSGFFVWADPIPAVGTGYTRGIEVQVLVNLTYKNKKGEITATSQGDLFSIHGATCVPERPHPDGWARCLPSENHAKGEKEWNHYRVEGYHGRITLAVNGHVVSGVSKCNPRKGYLALESEGSECHFKNLKIKELPSTDPKKEEIADEAQGHRPLYFGDLNGWKADDEAKTHWQPKDTVLHYDGKGGPLATEKEIGNAEYVVDFRFPVKNAKPCTLCFRANDKGKLKAYFDPLLGTYSVEKPTGKFSTSVKDPNVKTSGQWNRLVVTVKDGREVGRDLTVTLNGKELGHERGVSLGLAEKGRLVLEPEGEMDFANLFVRELK